MIEIIKKVFFSTTLLIIILLAVFFLVSKSALADGMMIKSDPDSDRWDYFNENIQQALINYNNGLQKMVISVGWGGENSDGVVWLFPIPSSPDKINVDVVKNMPDLGGEEISQKVKSNLVDATKFLMGTQFYTIPFLSLLDESSVDTLDMEGLGVSGLGLAGGSQVEQDVVVYKHLNKEGITSEIITAKTASALYGYFRSKGLKIEDGSIPILDSYIGKDYSFVASWINTSENLVPGVRGVFVTFPTKQIYFPLLPTSVYGNKIIPAIIRVIGYVSPRVFPAIGGYTKTSYYIDGYIDISDTIVGFFTEKNPRRDNIKYTKIEINAPSKLLTEDLWIANYPPLKTYYITFIALHPVISAIFLLIISSAIAGILAGLVIFRGLKKHIFKLGLIGVSNSLSIFGLLATIALVGTKERNEDIKPLLAQIKQKGYFRKRKIAAILLFADLPFLVIALLESLLGFNFTAHLLGIFISVAVLVFSLIISRIKPEDKSLFEQLISNSYSSWSFQPKDKMKVVFVPVFSILFLVISWLLVKLVGFTV